MFAENLAMKLIGLVTTLIILGAIYLFFVKPVLDTTHDAFNSVDNSINSAFDDAGFDDVNLNDLQNGDFSDIQQQIQSSDLSSQDQKQAEKLLHCIQRVQPDTTKMQACAQKYG